MKTPITPEGLPPQTAEDYLRGRYGAYRGHFAWRELEEAFNGGLRAQAASVEPVGKIINSGGNTGSLPEHPLLVWLGGVPPVGTELYASAPPSPASQYTDIVSDGGMDPRNASRQPQAQQGVAAPLELKVCHSQNASQTPQTDLSLMAAPQEWSPAYTRGPSRQSAPVTAVPAMVPLTEEQMVSAVRPLCNTDQVAERLVAVSIDEYRAIEAASAKLNGLTVGYGTAKAQPFDIRND